MIKVTITDTGAVDAFNRLTAVLESPRGPLEAIGEVLLAATKKTFQDSTDPYGEPWEPNSDTTLRRMLHSRSRSFTKKGKLSKKGQTLLAGKKPLIGKSKRLSTQFAPHIIGNDMVVVSSSTKYAAMQQFGGTKAQFPKLWGDIPARPFFPDEHRGLPKRYQDDIGDVLREALIAAIEGR